MSENKIQFHAKKDPHKFHDREDLTVEHPYGDKGQLVAMFAFFSIWIVDSFMLHWSTQPITQNVPWIFRLLLGGIMILVAAYLSKVGMDIVFGEVRDPPVVITKGPFLRLRHPVYFGEILLYSGLSIITGSIISMIVVFPIFMFMNMIANYEETRLQEKFGQQYKEYMKKVPRWRIKLHPEVFSV